MPTLLIKNAHIVTMDDHQREIPEGGLFIRRGLIQEVGPVSELSETADEVLDLKGFVVLPGLVNTCRPRRARLKYSSLHTGIPARGARIKI